MKKKMYSCCRTLLYLKGLKTHIKLIDVWDKGIKTVFKF